MDLPVAPGELVRDTTCQLLGGYTAMFEQRDGLRHGERLAEVRRVGELVERRSVPHRGSIRERVFSFLRRRLGWVY